MGEFADIWIEQCDATCEIREVGNARERVPLKDRTSHASSGGGPVTTILKPSASSRGLSWQPSTCACAPISPVASPVSAVVSDRGAGAQAL